MEDIGNQISSPSWWFSVVFVGLVLSIVSDYIRRWLENRYSNAVKAWSERSDARKERRRKLIELYSSSYDELQIAYSEMIDKRLEIIFQFLLAVGANTLGIYIDPDSVINQLGMWLGLIFGAFGLKATVNYGMFSLIVTEAKLALRDKENSR